MGLWNLTRNWKKKAILGFNKLLFSFGFFILLAQKRPVKSFLFSALIHKGDNTLKFRFQTDIKNDCFNNNHKLQYKVLLQNRKTFPFNYIIWFGWLSRCSPQMHWVHRGIPNKTKNLVLLTLWKKKLYGTVVLEHGYYCGGFIFFLSLYLCFWI